MNSITVNSELNKEVICLQKDRRNLAIFSIIITYLLVVASTFLVKNEPSWLTYSVAYLIIGIMQYRLLLSCHEAAHRTLLFPLWLNEMVGVFNGALIGINFTRYRNQHFNHHKARDVDNDPDAYIYRPILEAESGWRRAWVWLTGIFSEIVIKFKQKSLGIDGNSAQSKTAQLHSLAIVLVNIVLLFLFTRFMGWWSYFTFWLLPVMTVAVFLNRTRLLIEHGYSHIMSGINSTELPQASLLTIDLTSNPIESFFLAPYNFNYHNTHHAKPGVPYYNLPQLSNLLQDTGNESTINSSYFQALIKIFLIIMSQVIEHLLDPAAALNHLYQKLSPRGQLLIETPNVGGLNYYLFGQKYWGGYHIPRHLHLFTQKSLAQLVKQSGFKVVQQGYINSTGFWINSFRNFLGLSSAKRSRSMAEFINFSNFFVVIAFSMLDIGISILGFPTSNQFLIASKNS